MMAPAAAGGAGDGQQALLERAAVHVQSRLGRAPSVGLILGSGLGGLADAVESPRALPYAEVPGFPAATVPGHAGRLVGGTLAGVPVAVLQGRFHLYEGHDADVVAFPARLLVALGVRTLLVTNAAGGLDARMRPGDLMLIDDHINLQWSNPLVGPVRPGETRFPDMSEPYDRGLQALAERVALARGIALRRGVYCAVLGPSYETAAEVAMLRRIGGDAVGMSTVPEVLVARAAGVRVLGISLITNLATGLHTEVLTHEDVVAVGHAAGARLAGLVQALLPHLAD